MQMAPMSSRFIEACKRRATDVRPVWFMRQAGRYLKPYREIRAKHSILEICKKPELAAAVTLQPVEILDVDAAIIFADLLLPLEPMGLKVEFIAGEGRNSPLVEIAFVVEEISCVEGSVADEFESAAVDLVRAGLGDDVGEAGCAVADLRGHYSAAGLHLLNRIDVEVGEGRTAEFGIGGIRAVDCENRGDATLAVYRELLREIGSAVGIRHGSGGEEQQFAEVTLVEWEAGDFLTGKMLATTTALTPRQA